MKILTVSPKYSSQIQNALKAYGISFIIMSNQVLKLKSTIDENDVMLALNVAGIPDCEYEIN